MHSSTPFLTAICLPHRVPCRPELVFTWKSGTSSLCFTSLPYVIQCNEFTKIGVAENVDTRMAYLQVGNPYELKLLKAFPSRQPVVDEEKLQRRFGRYHIRGEWFRLPATLLRGLLRLDDLMNVHADAAKVRHQLPSARRTSRTKDAPTVRGFQSRLRGTESLSLLGFALCFS